MAYKTVPSPACPEGHARSQVHSDGERATRRGTTRKWRCRYIEDDGDTHQHFFSTRDETVDTRDLLDRVVAMPKCGREEHDGWRIDTNGTYHTADGPRQRYRCLNPDDPTERHTFTAPLPLLQCGLP